MNTDAEASALGASMGGALGHDPDVVRGFLMNERELLDVASERLYRIFWAVCSGCPVGQDLAYELDLLSSDLGELIGTLDSILEQCLKPNPGVPKCVDENRQLITRKTARVVTKIDRISAALGL